MLIEEFKQCIHSDIYMTTQWPKEKVQTTIYKAFT